MTMTGFSDILVRRSREEVEKKVEKKGERRQLLNLSGVYMKWILQMI